MIDDAKDDDTKKSLPGNTPTEPAVVEDEKKLEEKEDPFKRYSAFDYASSYAEYGNKKTSRDSTEEATEETDAEDESEETEESADKPMTLRDHFSELRSRLLRIAVALLVSSLVCFYFSEALMSFMYMPLTKVLRDGAQIIATGLPEPFIIAMKVSFAAGFFAASPYIFYQIWSFISPGLYVEERRFVIPVALTSAICFISGGAFCYFVVFPYAFEFFVNYTKIFISMPSATEYFDFTLQLIIVFGVVFELPLFAFFLARMGIINAPMLRKFRRYAILAAVIVAAILTPPDVVSQLLMAVPLVLLYEISIIVTAMFGKKKKEPETPASDEESEEEVEEEEKA